MKKHFDLIIFDFHKTLTDSVYFDGFDQETRNLISDLIFRPPNNEQWEKKWMTGELTYKDVLQHLSKETQLSYQELQGSLFSSLENIQWNQLMWDFSQEVRDFAKTAIATINTDLFNKFTIPNYKLRSKFHTIINSYDWGNDDKNELCIAAADQLGLNLKDHKVLLIDDKKKNVDDFINIGGHGFHYQSPEMFMQWIKS